MNRELLVAGRDRARLLERAHSAFDGTATSASVFVEDALVLALRERRRRRVYSAYAEAAQEEDFMSELDETERAFGATLGDGFH